jgi:hypothetical protein
MNRGRDAKYLPRGIDLQHMRPTPNFAAYKARGCSYFLF